MNTEQPTNTEPADPAGPAPGDLYLETGDKVKVEKMEFLWPGVIPLGCVTFFVGEAERGKSTFALDLAARVSAGAEWPDSTDDAPKRAAVGHVLILADEDNFARVILPKYAAAGGVRSSLIHPLGIVTPKGTFRKANLAQAFEKLQASLTRQNLPCPKLILIDPLNDFMRGVDMNTNNEVRDALDSLRAYAQDNQTAVVIVHHLNKNTKETKGHRVAGSAALKELSRSLCIFEHNQDSLEAPFTMRPEKSNYTEAKERIGVNFQIEKCLVRVGQPIYRTVRIVIVSCIHGESADLLESMQRRDAFKTQKAVTWLEKQSFFLSGQPILAAEILEAGLLAGFSERVMKLAKEQLGIQSDRRVVAGSPVKRPVWIPKD